METNMNLLVETTDKIVKNEQIITEYERDSREIIKHLARAAPSFLAWNARWKAGSNLYQKRLQDFKLIREKLWNDMFQIRYSKFGIKV